MTETIYKLTALALLIAALVACVITLLEANRELHKTKGRKP